jgi:hypothetical protein
MHPSEGPVRWKERGMFYLLSYLSLTTTTKSYQQKVERKVTGSVCVCVCVKKKHLVNFCVLVVPRVNFSPNSDDKMSSFKCLLPI